MRNQSFLMYRNLFPLHHLCTSPYSGLEFLTLVELNDIVQNWHSILSLNLYKWHHSHTNGVSSSLCCFHLWMFVLGDTIFSCYFIAVHLFFIFNHHNLKTWIVVVLPIWVLFGTLFTFLIWCANFTLWNTCISIQSRDMANKWITAFYDCGFNVILSIFMAAPTFWSWKKISISFELYSQSIRDIAWNLE
jgi:hypothetical protein